MNKEIDRGLESVSDAWHTVTENLGDGFSDLMMAIRLQVFRTLWVFFTAGLTVTLILIGAIFFLHNELGYSLAVACLMLGGVALVLGLAGAAIMKSLQPASAVSGEEGTLRKGIESDEEHPREAARDEFVSGVKDIRRGVVKAVSPLEMARRHPLTAVSAVSVLGLAVGARLFSREGRQQFSALRRELEHKKNTFLSSGNAQRQPERDFTAAGLQPGGQRSSESRRQDRKEGKGMTSEIVALLLPLAVQKLKTIAFEKGKDFLSQRVSDKEKGRRIDVSGPEGTRRTVAIPKGPQKEEDRHYIQ